MNQQLAVRVVPREERLERRRKMGVGRGTIASEPTHPGPLEKMVVQADNPAPLSKEQLVKEWVERQHQIHAKLPAPGPAASKVKKKDLPESSAGRVTIACIQEVVARNFDIDSAEVRGDSHTAAIALPKHIAMYLAMKMTGRGMPYVGHRFGGKNSTTVLHAKTKIAWLIGDRGKVNMRIVTKKRLPQEVDTVLAERVALLEQKIHRTWEEMRAAEEPVV